MKVSRTLLMAAISAVLLMACAPTTQVVPTTGNHPPTSPYQVGFYSNPPKQYEILGAVSVVITPELKWNDQGDATPAFNAMILQAAAMGANGIYFDQHANGAAFTAVAGYHGTFYTVPMHRDDNGTPIATATAVWVLQQ
jgi:hypothetical protein